MPTVITIANLKGGSSKTTTAAYLAHALYEAGLSVLVVDADPQASALRWSEAAGWPMPTVGLPVRTLHTQLAGIIGERDAVVIDTPPLEVQSGIVQSAMRAASLVVVPTAPTPIEVERLSAVRAALEDVGPLRPDGLPPAAAVLLTRTVAQAASTNVWRKSLTDDGWTVLTTEVRRLEQLAQAYGDPVKAAGGPYEWVANELLDLVLADQA
jgi:chromosome partitioning protein